MKIEEVREKAGTNQPRVHGNGFIQLDLGPGVRLHVWGHPSLPRQRVDTGIHDHRFGFISKVIVGRVINIPWLINPTTRKDDATHKVYMPTPREGEDTVLRDTGSFAHAYSIMARCVLAGDAYTMEAREFHETISDRPSITLMRKTYEISTWRPRVLVPLDKEPDNEFNRNQAMDADQCWRIIEEVLDQ